MSVFARLCLMVVALLCIATTLGAQDVEAVMKAPLLTGNGGVSVSHISNFAPGDSLSRGKDMQALFLAGSLNLNIKGVVDFPLAFAYTNGQANSQASLPFNRFAVAPSYKWVKVYGGFASLNLSPYTLAAHEIYGGGVELTPSNGWYAAAIYGRLQKASLPTEGNFDPAYQRMGGGFKLAYTHSRFMVGATLFKAKDRVGSLQFTPADSIQITPQDNLAGSLALGLSIAEGLQLSLEYGLSAINHNIGLSDSLGLEASRWIDTHGDFALFHAFKGNISQSTPIGTLGATYERVNPNYTTLGVYFMVNDFENITANYSGDILGVVNLAVDAGYQRDNLADLKSNTNTRFIMAGTASAAVTSKLNMGLSLSNMQSYVHITDPNSQLTQSSEYENLDTLSFTQLNYTGNLNASYQLYASKEQRQSLSGNVGMQRATDNQPGGGGFAGSSIYNGMLMYQLGLIPRKFNGSVSASYNHNIMQDSLYMGIASTTLTLQQTFVHDIKGMFNGTYSKSINQDGPQGNIVNLRLTGGYTIYKKHNFTLSAAAIYNQTQASIRWLYNINVGYNYGFNFVVQRQNKKWDTKGEF